MPWGREQQLPGKQGSSSPLQVETCASGITQRMAATPLAGPLRHEHICSVMKPRSRQCSLDELGSVRLQLGFHATPPHSLVKHKPVTQTNTALCLQCSSGRIETLRLVNRQNVTWKTLNWLNNFASIIVLRTTVSSVKRDHMSALNILNQLVKIVGIRTVLLEASGILLGFFLTGLKWVELSHIDVPDHLGLSSI